MSIFQCDNCGCAENSSYSSIMTRFLSEFGSKPTFDWTGIEDRRGKNLCSACMPSKFAKGTIAAQLDGTPYGQWHGKFRRIFLPKGMFITNKEGNLAHKDTGDTDIARYEISNGH